MNKLGIFMNFWENGWMADHVKYIEKASKIGFDVLEFQAQPLLEMSQCRMDELKAAAKHFGIELTYSLGLDKKPVCVAKTQYSLSDNPALLGRPSGFKVNVAEVRVSNGAGFIVLETGNITLEGPASQLINDENVKKAYLGE